MKKLDRKRWMCAGVSLCLLLLTTACAEKGTPGTAGAGEPSASAATTTTIAASTATASTTAANWYEPKVVIPMDEVPKKYYHADKNELTLIPKEQYDKTEVAYEDADGTEYLFDKETGVYRGFVAPTIIGTAAADSIPMDTLEKTADELASHFIRVADYERTYFLQEYTGVHMFRYRRKIAGYHTMDAGNVWITTDGNVDLVAFAHVGIFDGVTVPSIDETALDETFRKAIGDRKCTEIQDRILRIKDKRVYMQYEYIYTERSDQGDDFTELDTIEIPLA